MSELTTAARPYARAVFELASEKGDLDAWSKTLAFMGAVASNDDVRAILDNPKLTRAGKADAFNDICGDELNDEAKNLSRLLAEFDRLSILPEITTIFESLKDEAEGNIEATITSTQELSDDEIGRVTDALKSRLGRDVKVTTKIDESILGGMIIRAGDMVIDGSIQGRLQKMTHALNG